jgi:hypothetical protein
MSDMLSVHSEIELFMNASSVQQCNVGLVLCVLCVGSRCVGAVYEYHLCIAAVHSGIELFMNASSVWQCNVTLVLCVGFRCVGDVYEYQLCMADMFFIGVGLALQDSAVWATQHCLQWGMLCVHMYKSQLCLSVSCDSCPVFILFMNTSSVWECRLGHVLFSRWVGAVYEYQLCMGVSSGARSVFTVGWSCL